MLGSHPNLSRVTDPGLDDLGGGVRVLLDKIGKPNLRFSVVGGFSITRSFLKTDFIGKQDLIVVGLDLSGIGRVIRFSGHD